MVCQSPRLTGNRYVVGTRHACSKESAGMIVINQIFWVFTIRTNIMLNIFVIQDTYEVICRQYRILHKYI